MAEFNPDVPSEPGDQSGWLGKIQGDNPTLAGEIGGVSFDTGVFMQPGESVNHFYGRARLFLAAIAAKEVVENPDDQEARDRLNFWRDEVQKTENS